MTGAAIVPWPVPATAGVERALTADGALDRNRRRADRVADRGMTEERWSTSWPGGRRGAARAAADRASHSTTGVIS